MQIIFFERMDTLRYQFIFVASFSTIILLKLFLILSNLVCKLFIYLFIILYVYILVLHVFRTF